MERTRRGIELLPSGGYRMGCASGKQLSPMRLVAALAVILCATMSTRLSAQSIPSRSGTERDENESRELLTESEWKRGYHGLSILCQSQELSIVDWDEWRNTDPQESMLILLGDVSRIPIDLRDYANKGGAMLIASDRDSRRTLFSLGLKIEDGPVTAEFGGDAFQDVSDCVLIQSLSQSHPATENVERLVTNRPGLMGYGLPADRLDVNRRGILANYPAVRRRRMVSRPFNTLVFGWYEETRRGGRLIAVADQSMFSNQMLIYGDNALFLQQSLQWLRENPNTSQTRGKVLIIAGEPLPALDPSSVEIMAPPPDPSDVAKALQSLPRDVLLDFANSVVAAIQEEGIMNEMLRDAFRRQPPVVVRRWLLVVPAVIVACLLVWRLVTGTNTNDRERGTTSLIGEAYEPDSADAGYERFLAAHELFCSFQSNVSGIAGEPETASLEESSSYRQLPRRYQREIRVLNRELRRFRRDFWTEKRLVQVELQISQWKEWWKANAASAGRTLPASVQPS